MVVYACNPRTLEVEARDQEFKDNLHYFVTSRQLELHETLSQKTKGKEMETGFQKRNGIIRTKQ